MVLLNGFGFAKKIDWQINLVKEPRANRVATTNLFPGTSRIMPCTLRQGTSERFWLCQKN